MDSGILDIFPCGIRNTGHCNQESRMPLNNESGIHLMKSIGVESKNPYATDWNPVLDCLEYLGWSDEWLVACVNLPSSLCCRKPCALPFSLKDSDCKRRSSFVYITLPNCLHSTVFSTRLLSKPCGLHSPLPPCLAPPTLSVMFFH